MSSTLFEFPCDFTIKIIGTSSDVFISNITEIVLKHYPNTINSIKHHFSKQGHYTAMTVIVHANDKLSLDALYNELIRYPGIKMVL